MEYRFDRHEDLAAAVRRVAREQVDLSLAEIDDDTCDVHCTVHQVRKRTKMLRALLRLVRSHLDAAYRDEYRRVRDVARLLAPARDSQSLLHAFDDVVAGGPGLECPDQRLARRRLTDRRDGLVDRGVGLDEAWRALSDIRGRVDTWPLPAADLASCRGDFLRTWRAGRKALAKLGEPPAAAALHAWRKRAKNHWYHLRLLGDVLPREGLVRTELADHLARTLGDDHDLSLLEDALSAEPRLFGSAAMVRACLGACARARTRLQLRALDLGERIYGDDAESLLAELAGADAAG